MKINSQISFIGFLLIFITLFSINSSAISFDCQFTIPTSKSGTCINFIQTCSNCTSGVTLTAIYYPQSNGTVLYPNTAMTQHQNNYNYTFCDTKLVGIYMYSTEGSPSGTLTTANVCVEVTPSGDNLSGVQGAILFIPTAILFFLAHFLLCCFQHRMKFDF